MIYFFDTTDIYRTKTDIPQIFVENEGIFCGYITFYDEVKTTNPFPYNTKFVFVGVRNNKNQRIRRWKINRIRIWCCHISKISNSVGRNDNFRAKARKLSNLPTLLDIYDTRQHYIRILYL